MLNYTDDYTSSTATTYFRWVYAPPAPDDRQQEREAREARRAKRLACRRGWRERGVCRVARAGLPPRAERRVPQKRVRR